MSSSAFSLTLILPQSGLQIHEGTPVRGGAPGSDLRHMFCDSCKSWAFTQIDAFGITNVRASLLVDAAWFVPYLETCAITKMDWVQTPAIERYDEFPPPETMPAMLERYAKWADARGWPVPASR